MRLKIIKLCYICLPIYNEVIILYYKYALIEINSLAELALSGTLFSAQAQAGLLLLPGAYMDYSQEVLDSCFLPLLHELYYMTSGKS